MFLTASLVLEEQTEITSLLMFLFNSLSQSGCWWTVAVPPEKGDKPADDSEEGVGDEARGGDEALDASVPMLRSNSREEVTLVSRSLVWQKFESWDGRTFRRLAPLGRIKSSSDPMKNKLTIDECIILINLSG